jgi:hypothetical protein
MNDLHVKGLIFGLVLNIVIIITQTFVMISEENHNKKNKKRNKNNKKT